MDGEKIGEEGKWFSAFESLVAAGAFEAIRVRLFQFDGVYIGYNFTIHVYFINIIKRSPNDKFQ